MVSIFAKSHRGGIELNEEVVKQHLHPSDKTYFEPTSQWVQIVRMTGYLANHKFNYIYEFFNKHFRHFLRPCNDMYLAVRFFFIERNA